MVRDDLAMEWMGHRICVVLMERAHPTLPSQMLSFSIHAHALGFLKWLRLAWNFRAGQLLRPSHFKLFFLILMK